jgi:hypothetical protein
MSEICYVSRKHKSNKTVEEDLCSKQHKTGRMSSRSADHCPGERGEHTCFLHFDQDWKLVFVHLVKKIRAIRSLVLKPRLMMNLHCSYTPGLRPALDQEHSAPGFNVIVQLKVEVSTHLDLCLKRRYIVSGFLPGISLAAAWDSLVYGGFWCGW